MVERWLCHWGYRAHGMHEHSSNSLMLMRPMNTSCFCINATIFSIAIYPIMMLLFLCFVLCVEFQFDQPIQSEDVERSSASFLLVEMNNYNILMRNVVRNFLALFWHHNAHIILIAISNCQLPRFDNCYTCTQNYCCVFRLWCFFHTLSFH